ncbi:unnamed protein product [Pseudo-nitzschia multistriata]|uniref:Carboxyvinyl-carboxyphosphonate phosphorylmutase n=1 Tax=Pseudo-nitzschia multistriata TaxID=183589 RepID=A0A448Z3A2_9STRA|nr:unnamed protein product [Pseudo-nitzschia multistriata]
MTIHKPRRPARIVPAPFAAVVLLLACAASGARLSRPKHQSPPDLLHGLIEDARRDRKAVRVVGVHDALSARIVQQQSGLLACGGRVGLFVSGFGVSASRLGRPDASILTRSEIEDAARNVVRAVSNTHATGLPPPPVLVDGDTGFGGAANVRETIRRTASIGAAAITIEDQVFPKRCTYLAGSGIGVVSRAEATDRIGAALAARDEALEADGNPIFVVARTDCRMALGLDEAIERCLAFQDMGADVVYAENLQSGEEYLALRRAVTGGSTASEARGVAPMVLAQFQTGAENQRLYSADEVGAMGYEMALYGVAGLQATVSALRSAVSELLGEGSGGIVRSTPLSALDEIKEVVGFSDLDDFERRHGCT